MALGERVPVFFCLLGSGLVTTWLLQPLLTTTITGWGGQKLEEAKGRKGKGVPFVVLRRCWGGSGLIFRPLRKGLLSLLR